MTHIANKIIKNSPDLKPAAYCRYVDDWSVIAENPENILTLIIAFRQASVFNFTHELGEKQQLNSVDVHIDGSQSMYKSAVSFLKNAMNTKVY